MGAPNGRGGTTVDGGDGPENATCASLALLTLARLNRTYGLMPWPTHRDQINTPGKVLRAMMRGKFVKVTGGTTLTWNRPKIQDALANMPQTILDSERMAVQGAAVQHTTELPQPSASLSTADAHRVFATWLETQPGRRAKAVDLNRFYSTHPDAREKFGKLKRCIELSSGRLAYDPSRIYVELIDTDTTHTGIDPGGGGDLDARHEMTSDGAGVSTCDSSINGGAEQAAITLLHSTPDKQMLLSALCASLYQQGFKAEIAAAGSAARFFIGCKLLHCDFESHKQGSVIVCLADTMPQPLAAPAGTRHSNCRRMAEKHLERHLSTNPTISEEVEILLKDYIEKNQISVHLAEWEIKRQLPQLQGNLFHEIEVDKDATATFLIREAQKGTAWMNKEKLYAGDESEQLSRKQGLLSRIATYEQDHEQDQLHAGLASGTPIAKALTKLAKDVNCTTTYLGKYLAGTREFEAAVDRSRDRDAFSPVEYSREARIADAAVSIAGEDRVSGFMAKSKRFTANPVSEGNMARRGKEGEAGVEKLLKESGLKAGSDYTTEKGRVISECVEHPEGDRATPDFLFEPPLVIHGKDIRWIEVKNSLFISNVSLDSQSQIKLQAQKYVERFGQGAFVWTKCGFAKSMDKLIPGVVNLSYTVAHTGRRPKQTDKQPALFPSRPHSREEDVANATPPAPMYPVAPPVSGYMMSTQQLGDAILIATRTDVPFSAFDLSVMSKVGNAMPRPTWGKGRTIHNDSATSSSSSAPIVDARALVVDVGEPTTILQVRLADGSRKLVEANHTHTVLQLRAHISTLSPGLTFTLKVGFPPKPLPDEQLSLAGAKLLSETIIQTDARPQATGTVSLPARAQ